MPKVGNKSFPYTEAGKKKAARYARATGQQVEGAEGSRRGQNLGRLSPYPGPGRPGPFAGGRNRGPRNAVRRPGPGTPPPPGGMRGRRGPRNVAQNPLSRVSPGGRGGSRVMRNPGLSGRPSRNPRPTPGFQRRKPRPGGSY